MSFSEGGERQSGARCAGSSSAHRWAGECSTSGLVGAVGELLHPGEAVGTLLHLDGDRFLAALNHQRPDAAEQAKEGGRVLAGRRASGSRRGRRRHRRPHPPRRDRDLVAGRGGSQEDRMLEDVVRWFGTPAGRPAGLPL
jgi:hypothetical protein